MVDSSGNRTVVPSEGNPISEENGSEAVCDSFRIIVVNS